MSTEVVLGIAVLVVTAILVNAPPARVSAGAITGPAAVTLRARGVAVDITIAPGTQGTNDVHVSTFTPAGAPLGVEELTLVMDIPERKIPPLDIPLRRLGPGHYLSPGFEVPLAATWRITAKVRTTDIDEVTATGTLTIR
jgi:copper transport protein